MALSEKGVDRFAESIVVKFFSRNVPKQFGTGVISPLANVDEAEGTKHSSRDEYGEDVSKREFGLWIRWEMLVDDLSNFHALKQRRYDG